MVSPAYDVEDFGRLSEDGRFSSFLDVHLGAFAALFLF